MKRLNLFWLGSTPWIIIGSVIILVPIFIFWALDNIQRHKEATTHLLLEKGAALIRSFEAGTRTGMMGMMGMHGSGRFQLQRLLVETAQQPDIAYIIVTDKNGRIEADSDPEKIGGFYGQDLNLNDLSKLKDLQWRRIANPSGPDFFEVYRLFSPTRVLLRRSYRRVQPDLRRLPPESNTDHEPTQIQFIFLGLDMGPIEEDRIEESKHILIMAGILLLIGFTGISSLFLVQAYRSTRTSLTRIKAFSDNVVENMPIGLSALDMEDNIVSFNQTAESILQIPMNQALGKKAGDILPGQFQTLLHEKLPANGTLEKELDCNLRDGKVIPMDVSISSLEGDDGVSMGRIILFRDLTEIQGLKNEIELSRRLASIGKLAAGVAHEIRNPLSSIKGFATYFRERYKEVPEDRKTAEIMVQEVERLNRVIGQLLEFARPVTLQKKPIKIQALIRHSLKIIEKKAHDKHIDIIEDIDPDLPEVSMDADQMNQVLLNLYLNALESMANGGQLTLEVRSDTDSQRLRIMIRDTGRGIEKNDLAHIFDPYFTTKQAGTGLGLAIVHKIIESHNGEIKVESKPDLGTSVIILLPYT